MTDKNENDLDQSIRERAYFMWQADGCPDGEADLYWRRAEERIEAETHSAYPPAQTSECRS
jgi:hypothetical protein